MSKAERTRQYIIEKTAPIFNLKGYAGTSLNDITIATGLTKGSIYGNFDSKDDVAVAAFDHNFGKVVSLIRGKMSERTTVIDKLMVYPEIYRDFLKIPFLKAGCPLLNTAVEADDTHLLLKERASKALKLWRTSVEKLVALGIETKELRSDAGATEFAAILISLVEGAIMQAKLTGKPSELHVTMHFLQKLIMDLKR